METILKSSDLTIGYKKKSNTFSVLSSLNLSLNCGELVSILGENGAGKSTLIRSITGLQLPLSGNVYINNINIKDYTPKQLSKLIAIVSTERTFAGGLLVEELVALGRQPYTGFLGRLNPDDKEIISKSMELVGIEQKRKSYVAELSDGERQKAMIAKALAQEAKIIILDEPTAFLDVKSKMSILMLLHKLAHNEDRAILVSSHDIRQSLQLSDRLWLLCQGKIVCGCTEDLVLRGELNKLFPTSKIKFDIPTGDFEITYLQTKTISIQTADISLNKWLTNALKRNGYSIEKNSGDTVTAESPNHIKYNGKSFESIDRLLNQLNSNNL